MSKKVTTMLDANAALVAAVTAAVQQAAAAGLSAGDITAALNRIVEIVDTEE